MAVFTFTGDPHAPGTDPLTCELGGVVFTFLTPKTVDDEALIKRLRRHSHFTETGGDANLGDFDGDKKPGGSVVAVTGIKAIHKGRGKWAVTDGKTILADGLTKDDAHAKAAELSA
jgi:hypothetical protein